MRETTRSTSASPNGPGGAGPPLASLFAQQGVLTDDDAPAAGRGDGPVHPLATPSGGGGRSWWSQAAGPGPREWQGPEDPATVPFTLLDESTSAPTLVSRLLDDATRCGATDIHLDPTPAGVAIRVRIDGILHEVGTLPEDAARHVRSRIKVLAGMDLI